MDTGRFLKKGLDELGFSSTEWHIKTFITYLSELKKWNRAYNLTSLKTDRDIIIKHFLDSLLYLNVIPAKALKIADAGTGAGFPGIPMKVMRPEIDLTLIESSRKKSAFLRHIIRLLQLKRTNVLNRRIENLGENYAKTYDAIVSRATFKVKDFLDRACPYIKENGILVLSKGPKILEETGALKDQRVLEKVMTFHLNNLVRQLILLRCKK
jgi:16S rRNA (guanine527-N7)-methyltransferase